MHVGRGHTMSKRAGRYVRGSVRYVKGAADAAPRPRGLATPTLISSSRELSFSSSKYSRRATTSSGLCTRVGSSERA